MSDLQVDLTIFGREFREGGLYDAIEDGGRTKLTGEMTLRGLTYTLEYESEAGEYGGSSLEIVPDIGEDPDYETIHDYVVDIFTQRLWDAKVAAGEAFKAALAANATTTETIEI